jgi:signal-transduction protein with cAMP-binding, CBS, and nucleotidyltransferase domain
VVDDETNRHLRGVVTDRDLAIRILAAGKDGGSKVSDYLTEQV